MFCRFCGTDNGEQAAGPCMACGRDLAAAAAPGAPPPPPAQQSMGVAPGYQIPNYLVPSILVTLFCCLPLGVAAIVFAAQVNTKVAAGDIAGAQDASDKAKLFCWLSFGLGLFVTAAYIGLMMLGAMAEMST